MALWFSKNKTTALVGTAFRYPEPDAGLLSRYSSHTRSPTTVRIDQVFFAVLVGLRENAYLVHKIKVAMHTYNAALLKINPKISPKPSTLFPFKIWS